ncbi:acetamidase/formamidase family protein [Kineococcus arenarius]|uniref:acetamidase/formamidase family protein n=1 Tax=Kineococcus sp. SYSU DK007 TaxID=3383128 RepID=UPI003D7D893A
MAVPVSGGLFLAPAEADPRASAPVLVDPLKADHHLRATSDTLVWGGFPIDQEPGATMKSGETVRIDTISHTGITNPDVAPEDYWKALGVDRSEILPESWGFWQSLPERQNLGGGHVLTGPVYVEGAEPGDMIEIEVLDLDTRVPYGVNNTGPTSGVFSPTYPGWREEDQPLDIPAEIPEGTPGGVLADERHHLYRTGEYKGEEVVFFDEGVVIPQQKFMGIMAVAPPSGEFVGRTQDAAPPASGVQISTPPGKYGGNLDVKDLTEGSTLYLPVFQGGAQVFMGDAHTSQGDGEVSGTAVEHSLAGTFRITVHKQASIEGPWAEDEDNWIMMGIDWDLDRAMRNAVANTVDFLVREKGMTQAKAYSFASVSVDYRVAEVVDGTQVVTGMIPKDVFEDSKGSKK